MNAILMDKWIGKNIRSLLVFFFSVFFCCSVSGFVWGFFCSASSSLSPHSQVRTARVLQVRLLKRKDLLQFFSFFFVLISWYEVRGIGFVGINRLTLVVISHPAHPEHP